MAVEIAAMAKAAVSAMAIWSCLPFQKEHVSGGHNLVVQIGASAAAKQAFVGGKMVNKVRM